MPTPPPIQANRVLPLLLPLTMAACDSSPAAPAGGVVAIAVHTGGSSLDADGYVVRVGSRERIPVQISGAEEVSVEAGDYLVEVTDVASNCAVLGTNPRMIAIADGGNASTDFDIECDYVPRDLVFMSDRGGDEDIYALGTDGSYPVRLTTDPADDSRPTWSPGGERIAFMRDGALFVMDAGGADPRALQGGNDQPSVREFEWSPDGTRLAYTKAGDGGWFGEEGSTTVWITDVDGGDPVDLAEGYGATWSPDGTSIAFTSRRDDNSEIYLVEAEGSDPVNLTNHPARDRAPAWATQVAATSVDGLRG